MEIEYLVIAAIGIIISIIILVKFLQMASDIRLLKEHFVSSSTNTSYNTYITKDEEIKGIIRKNGGINYTMINGKVNFSDGKTGVIIYGDNNTYQIEGDAYIHNDIYQAIEALYDTLLNDN